MRTFRTKAKQRLKWSCQLAVAVLLTVSGLALLAAGFWCAPRGEIDGSVLIGFGEVATFAGALFGVDYTYKSRPRRP